MDSFSSFSSFYSQQLAILSKFLNAAQEGNLHLIKKIAKTADITGVGVKKTCERMADGKERHALHLAASKGKIHVCQYFIEDLEFDVNLLDGLCQTPLHHAALGNHLETATYLIEHGANITLACNRGSTALHNAAEKGNIELLRMLILRGADVEAQSFWGTPLECAAAYGKEEAIKFLLDNNANPSPVSKDEVMTPLFYSIMARSPECMNLLLKAGADPNSMSCGSTALVISIMEGQNDIVKYLLKAGADANILDPYGSTPLEIAAWHDNHEGVNILFPVTTRIPSIPEWTIDGVLRHGHSEEFEQQRDLKGKELFVIANTKGKEAVKRNNFANAMYWFTEAINIGPADEIVYANRSFCWARLNVGSKALADAKACIKLKPEWKKAHFRAGVAYTLLERHSEAAAAYKSALRLDPKNKELQQAYRDAEAAAASLFPKALG